MLEDGHQAPDFALDGVDGSGERVHVRLSDLRGSVVVLYFYPKDDTPGCTKQACGLRDEWDAFTETGAVVLGVSPDDPDRHRKFASKYDLPFTLLSDPDHEAAEAYGVWKEKSMYGRKFWGIERSTFVIDAEGRIEKAMHRVKPAKHAAQVLDVLSG
jgi:thioredoxin-dependent peroxiredoxin